MHPPWITFNFILLLSGITNTASRDAEQNAEAVNSTASRSQREVYERERRLIPYTTYYVTQSLTSPNDGAKQSILIPVTSPRGNVFQLDAVPKTPVSNIQNGSPQPIQVLPKPMVRLTSPTFLTPTIQVGQYKPKEGTFPQIYRLQSGIIRPQIQAQVHPQQIQSETQPLQVIKVNPVPTEQKFTAPQIVKLIPVITKLPPEGRPPPKSVDTPQPQFAYSRDNVQHLPQHPATANYQIYYKESVPSRTETSFQENKAYANHDSRENEQPKLFPSALAPDSNSYAIAKIILSTTTPSPFDVKFNVNDGGPSTIESNVHRVSIAHLRQPNPPQIEYVKHPVLSTVPSFTREKYVTVAPSTQPLTYVQRANGGLGQEPQYVIQSQEVERLPKLRVPEEEKIRFVARVTQAPVTNDLESGHWKVNNEAQIEKNYERESLNNIFSLLKETNKLPQNLTPDNIDTGIKTLALILERLQEQRNLYQAQNNPTTGSTTAEPLATTIENHKNPKKIHSFPEKSGTSTPGRPGIDYPTYSTIPHTNFDCSTQRYKGFFGDPDTKCQVWHYCDLNGGQASFLCPNGTIFSQVALTCDWWFNVKCASTSQLYVLNERLYKYILPFSPSFPEDYSGPVVDTYLEAKFKEMEAKSKLKGQKSQGNSTTTEKQEFTTEVPTNLPTEYVAEYQKQNAEV